MIKQTLYSFYNKFFISMY